MQYCSQRPGSNVLVLVEHPAIGLAHSLGKDDDIDPEAWLDDWLASARTIVAYAQRNPDTTLVVNADEVRRRPRRLAQLLQVALGRVFAAPSRVGQDHQPDPLAHALAWSFVERDLALQDVLPELMAGCVVLPGFRSAGARLMPEGTVDGAEAARRLAELMQTERHLAQVESRSGDRARRASLRAAGRGRRMRAARSRRAGARSRSRQNDERADAADRALVDARSRLEAVSQGAEIR